MKYVPVGVFVFFCCSLLTGSGSGAQQKQHAAQAAAGGLTQGLTWRHNGRVFSILSRGSRFQPPARSRSASSRGVPPLAGANETSAAIPVEPRMPAANAGAQLRAKSRQRPPPRVEPRAEPRPDSGEDRMAGDDPYNPYKASNYYPYYNYYNSYYRPRAWTRHRHGYGTRYHQNGEKCLLYIKLITMPWKGCFKKKNYPCCEETSSPQEGRLQLVLPQTCTCVHICCISWHAHVPPSGCEHSCFK